MSKDISTKSKNYLLYSVQFLLVFLLLLFILNVSRLVTNYFLVQDVYQSLSNLEKFQFWFVSFRFDLKTVTLTLSPILAYLIFGSYWNISLYQKISNFYYGLLLLIFSLVSIANYLYIKTFGHSFDLMIFGIVKEDFNAVMTNIWLDYTIIKILLISSFILIASFCLLNSLSKFSFLNKTFRVNNWALIVFVTIFIFIWVVLVRGRLGTFPLRKAEITVTTEPKINNIVPNGVLSLFWVIKDRFKIKKMQPVYFDELKIDLEYFGINPINRNEDPLNYIKQITRKNTYLEQNKPNVILIVMESMSSDMLQLDNKEHFDVLGQLRDVLENPNVYFFDNVISEGDGTIDSLSRILVQSGDDLDLTVSQNASIKFATSASVPYKISGYRTAFITAGGANWRNIGDFVRNQEFDDFIDDKYILKNDTNAEQGVWGIFDEYMFNISYDYLLKNENDAKFITILSITNHPPYELPHNYVSKLNHNYEHVSAKYKNDDIFEMYETFRYANDSLGKFLKKILANKHLSNNTVIAITGDHNVRGLNVYNKIEKQILGHQVPLIIFIPPQVKQNLPRFEDFDVKRYASHKDIMPTLFNITLSSAPYYYMGCNLFDNKANCLFDFSFNGSLLVDKSDMCLNSSNDKNNDTLMNFVLQKNKFQSSTQKSLSNDVCVKYEKFRSLLNWYHRYQCLGKMD